MLHNFLTAKTVLSSL